MAIEYLQILTIPVSNQERAKHFYVDILGWKLLSDEHYSSPKGESLRWLEVRPKESQTAITLAAADGEQLAGSMKSMTLRATDLERTIADLRQKGVAFDEIQETQMARYTRFQDPDGNTWMVQELRAGNTPNG